MGPAELVPFRCPACTGCWGCKAACRSPRVPGVMARGRRTRPGAASDRATPGRWLPGRLECPGGRCSGRGTVWIPQWHPWPKLVAAAAGRGPRPALSPLPWTEPKLWTARSAGSNPPQCLLQHALRP